MERGFTAALMIGALYTEAHMTELWEDTALSGEKSRQGARTSGRNGKARRKATNHKSTVIPKS